MDNLTTLFYKAELLMLFQMVYSVLLSVLHFKTILLVDPDWLLKVFHQPAAGSLRATQRAKWITPSERALKTELNNGIGLFVAFVGLIFVYAK